FKYRVAVYWPAEGSREFCVLNLINDVFYELRRENMGYFISRSGKDREGIDLQQSRKRIDYSEALNTVRSGL
ncbi:hypothetical protein AAVH_38423, partial [Aphelenchoides avenae]